MTGCLRWKVEGLAAVLVLPLLLAGMVRMTRAQETRPAESAGSESATSESASTPQPTRAKPPAAEPQSKPQPRSEAGENAPEDQPPSAEPQPSLPQPNVPSGIRLEDSVATTTPRYRRSRFFLARVPNMYGDTLPPGAQIQAGKGLLYRTLVDIPLAGGARRIKVAENNKALPMDRVFVQYNHFENALDAFYTETVSPAPTTTLISAPIDRVVIGVEKTFHDELWSLDVRMPFVSDFSFSQPSPEYSISGGEVGNLHATAKVLLTETDHWATSAGLGVDIPTGSDVHGTTVTHVIEINNDAVHLMPFWGFVGAPRKNWFYHGFVEVDVPLNGNGVSVGPALFPVTGTLNEQTALNLDFGSGCWLYRDPAASLLTGLAAIAEVHYTTTLNRADLIRATTPQVDYVLSNFADHMDIANATVGFHAEIAHRTTLRVAGVFPLTDESDRLFDAEVQIQLNRYF